MSAVTRMKSTVALLLLLAITPIAHGESNAFHPAARIRRPTALAWARDRLFVANQRSGSISIVNTNERQVIAEIEVGESLVDLELSHDAKLLWALDSDAARLLSFEINNGELHSASSTLVPFSPVSIALSRDEKLLSVASLWPRKLTLFKTDTTGTIELVTELALPFSPREQLYLSADHLLVADAFAGKLAVVDVSGGSIVAVHDTSGQNIRGLTLNERQVGVRLTMQRLNSYRATTHEDVFWGGVLQNLLVEIGSDDLLNSELDWYAAQQDYYLGGPNDAAGDPDSILITHDGRTLIALAGVHQIAIRKSANAPLEIRSVGARPVDIAVDEAENTAFIACQMDDSLAIVDLTRLKVTGRIALGPPVPEVLADRGEALFYDATLSLDGWFSCHSCHTDGHSTGLLNDNFGDHSTGAPKRVLSLLGTADTAPWGWTGSAASLEQQVRKSLESTMQSPLAVGEPTTAIAAFLRTLPPPPAGSVRDAIDAAAVARGSQVFQKRGCVECHAGPQSTNPELYDVGIHDQAGNKEFNPPSLRGISHRNEFFHDNRAQSLKDVFERFQHPGGEVFAADELGDLLEYLRSL